jgi:hypothetical protein
VPAALTDIVDNFVDNLPSPPYPPSPGSSRLWLLMPAKTSQGNGRFAPSGMEDSDTVKETVHLCRLRVCSILLHNE